MRSIVRHQDEIASARALDARRLRTLHLELLGRPPLAAERAEWHGRTNVELLDALLGSRSFWANWLEEQLYYFLLIDNFRPTSERVRRIPDDLAAGTLGVRDALHRVAISASFDRRNPGPDTFVTVVMEQLLGATVQKERRELEIGKRVYDGGSGVFLGESGSSQADVVRIAIESRAALEHYLAREHQRVLRKAPPARELAAWVRALERGELEYVELLRTWLLSEAYEARLAERAPLSNRAFVRALFVDLVGREPDPGEARRLRNAMDGLADAAPLRSVMARLLIDSGSAPLPEKQELTNPTEWIVGLFERLLGRAPSGEELTTFTAAFQDPACRPATVLYAIVSHPEYPTW